jgi:predicted transcriptional regulator
MARPKKNEKDILKTAGVKLDPETIKLLDQISDRTETSRSWAARRLLLLGLERYFRDRSAIFQASTHERRGRRRRKRGGSSVDSE